MNEENPNVGKQFKDIIGSNFSPEETKQMSARAEFDESDLNDTDRGMEVDRETTALSRMHGFPKDMIHYNDQHGYHIKLTTPRGWTHIWSGGPYIEHQSSPGNSEDVTNLTDYSKNTDQQDWYKGISLPTFLGHVNEFEKNAEEDYPDEHKPPRQ